MPRYFDRIKDTTTTTGTGDITLSGTAPTGYTAFASRYSVGDLFTYCIVAQSGGEWETGEGYLSGSTTLVRSSVTDGSSGLNTAVNFSAGTKDVFVTATAHFLMDHNGGALYAKVRGYDMT